MPDLHRSGSVARKGLQFRIALRTGRERHGVISLVRKEPVYGLAIQAKIAQGLVCGRHRFSLDLRLRSENLNFRHVDIDACILQGIGQTQSFGDYGRRHAEVSHRSVRIRRGIRTGTRLDVPAALHADPLPGALVVLILQGLGLGPGGTAIPEEGGLDLADGLKIVEGEGGNRGSRLIPGGPALVDAVAVYGLRSRRAFLHIHLEVRAGGGGNIMHWISLRNGPGLNFGGVHEVALHRVDDSGLPGLDPGIALEYHGLSGLWTGS